MGFFVILMQVFFNYSYLNESRNDELNVYYYLKYMEIFIVLCFEIFGLVGQKFFNVFFKNFMFFNNVKD